MSERLFPVDGRTPRERAETRARVAAGTPSLFSDADFATVAERELDRACPVCASTEHTGLFGCRHGDALVLDLDENPS